jgi:superkiller protein 3
MRGTVLPAFPDPLVTGLQTLAVGTHHLLEQGDEAFERGDLPGAEAAFREAIGVDHGSVRAHRSLASVLALRGRLSDAISAYRAALRLAPDDPRLHHDLGVLLTRAGRLEESVSHLRRSLELAPDNPSGHASLADALERSGRLDEAVAAAADAADLLPGDSRATIALERLRLLRAVDPRKEPEAELRRVLAADPSRAMALLALGGLLEARGEPAAALAAYRKVLSGGTADPARAPLEARAHLLIARRLAAEGDGDGEVLEHLRAATRLAPDLPEAHSALAAGLAARGEAAGAADAYRLALGLDPSDAAAHAGLAEALLGMGRCIEAREHLERNVSRVPEGSGLRELLERVRGVCGEAGGG